MATRKDNAPVIRGVAFKFVLNMRVKMQNILIYANFESNYPNFELISFDIQQLPWSCTQ